MSHVAIENLSVEPTTPTISTVSSELSFENVAAMDAEMPVPNALKEHPTLYIRNDMVKIQVCGHCAPVLAALIPHQVEDTLFRLPSHFLADRSTYFANLFKGKDFNSVVVIAGSDISSSAFAHFLMVLQVRPS
jgi:hypothetical protein